MSGDFGRISLPAINGAQESVPSPMRPNSRTGNLSPDQAPPIPEVSSKFNAVFQQLTEISFPVMNHESSVKGRINILEGAAEAQSEFNNMSIRTFAELNNSLHGAEDMIKMILKQSQDQFDNKLAQMRKEYDHRCDTFWEIILLHHADIAIL